MGGSLNWLSGGIVLVVICEEVVGYACHMVIVLGGCHTGVNLEGAHCYFREVAHDLLGIP